MTQANKINPHARRKARRLALQALYQWQSTQQHPSDVFSQFLQEQDVSKADVAYFEEILRNVVTHQKDLDEQLQPLLSRPLRELDPIELAILRLAMYELCHRPEIPYRVVINEAVELAKTFGATEGHKFVNGVLDRAAHSLRNAEIKAAS